VNSAAATTSCSDAIWLRFEPWRTPGYEPGRAAASRINRLFEWIFVRYILPSEWRVRCL
jgi:hypothetical protein